MRLQGTAWNRAYSGGRDILAPPFDFDGDPETFGEEERGVVQRVWQRVAEDFAPFDVDVTTERGSDSSIAREGAGDEAYGIRVLISPISRYFGHYGGLAYLNVFSELGDAHRTVLVFPDLLGESDKFLGEACAHEVGHALGLTHDGSVTAGEYDAGHGFGQTGWAPIMGAGYYQNLTQWSRGEYQGANNRQDDLEVMVASGLKWRPDDHGDTPQNATVIPSGFSVVTTGIIGAGDDVDVFAVAAGAGLARFALEVEGIGPDLDGLLEVRDADGRLLGASNPAGALEASLELALTEGTYFVSVAGTGLGDPLGLGYPRYGSMGAYRLVSSVPVPPPPRPPPVAVISATSTAGISFVFDGTLSTAPGGELRRFVWSFDDGTLLEGSVVSKTFATAGSHEVVLTVTDDRGVSMSAKRSMWVNAPPVALLSILPGSILAGVPISFSGSGSRDPDGTIVRWEWSFGDGTTAAVEAPQKAYAQAGTYTVVLNVLDNTGASATASRSLLVESVQLPTFRLGRGDLAVVPLAGGRRSIQFALVVTDSAGEPVSGAKVVGNWGGALAGGASALTSTVGVVKILSPPITSSGAVEFVLSGVSKAGFDRWLPGTGQMWSPVWISP